MKLPAANLWGRFEQGDIDIDIKEEEGTKRGIKSRKGEEIQPGREESSENNPERSGEFLYQIEKASLFGCMKFSTIVLNWIMQNQLNQFFFFF